MSASLTRDLPNPGATETLGLCLGSLLFPGAVVALVGPLGAGKTFLVRALAKGMGLTDPALVTSPTYVLIQEYRARLPIFHFDAYRLRCVVEFLDLGIEEYYAAQGVCLVEWADRVPGALPEQHLQIQLEVTGPDSRRATLTAFGSPYETLLEKVSGQPKGGGTADNWAASSYSV